MPSITELPCEIVAIILSSLDHPRDLLPALLTCHHFYMSFKESHGVAASILRQQITPALLPVAVAVMEASRLPRPFVDTAVLGLLDELYRSPARLAARVSALPLLVVQKMSRIHDAVHALATDFGARAQARISHLTTITAVSPTEYFRFCRALYRVELFYAIFQHGDFDDKIKPWFLWKHQLWENEQIASAYEYLEERFVQASRDVLAHDVDFGEMGVDYLSVGDDNLWTQGWLSHGVELVHKLTIADSYDAEQSLLHGTSRISDSEISLPEALLEVESMGDRTVGQYSEADLRSLAQRHGDEVEDDNTDRGPYEAWRKANSDRWLEDSVMLSEAGWLRDRAYVFWDGDRLRSWEPGGFGDESGDWRDYTDAEHKEMMESYHERSKIWQKGGKGYWNKNDTSRIIWPQGVPPSS